MQATFERVSLAGRAALTESLPVLTPDHTLITGSDRSVVEVMSYFVDTYPVDTREGRCTCPDHEHRNARCEYLRRTAVGLGREPVAAAVLDAVDVNDDLGVNAPGPRVAAADGKPGVIDAGDDADILTDANAVDETDDSGEPGKGDDGRPDDRCCWDDTGERPCWPSTARLPGDEPPARPRWPPMCDRGDADGTSVSPRHVDAELADGRPDHGRDRHRDAHRSRSPNVPLGEVDGRTPVKSALVMSLVRRVDGRNSASGGHSIASSSVFDCRMYGYDDVLTSSVNVPSQSGENAPNTVSKSMSPAPIGRCSSVVSRLSFTWTWAIRSS